MSKPGKKWIRQTHLDGDIRITLDAKRDFDGVTTWVTVYQRTNNRWRLKEQFIYDASAADKIAVWRGKAE